MRDNETAETQEEWRADAAETPDASRSFDPLPETEPADAPTNDPRRPSNPA